MLKKKNDKSSYFYLQNLISNIPLKKPNLYIHILELHVKQTNTQNTNFSNSYQNISHPEHVHFLNQSKILHISN